jgi:hypothetical protein
LEFCRHAVMRHARAAPGAEGRGGEPLAFTVSGTIPPAGSRRVKAGYFSITEKSPLPAAEGAALAGSGPPSLSGWAGITEKQAAGYLSGRPGGTGCWRNRVTPCGISEGVAVWDLRRLPGGVAVIGENAAVGRMGKVLHPAAGVSFTTAVGLTTQKPGGQSRPRCGNTTAGRPGRPPENKKRTQGGLRFFSTFRPPATGRGLPLPL